MPTLRALLYAAVPGAIVFVAFGIGLGVPAPVALALGGAFTLAVLYFTRVVHEEPEEELAAWAAEAPELGSWHEPSPRVAGG